MTRGALWAVFLAAAALSLGARSAASQEGFAGSWSVVKTQPAPWLVGDPSLSPYLEPGLVHATITFRHDRIEAPAPLGCRTPAYKIEALPPGYLFEGGLDDPDRGMTDPKGAAAALGFKSDRILTLETGCAEMNYHMIDADTLMFALDNVLYTLRRKHH